MNDSPVVPIELGQALKISLDNYYDLLKTTVGGLQAEEYLQLKLVADPLDISDEKYRYWSQYNLLNRADLAIEPSPVSGTLLTSLDQLSRVYGSFLRRLRGYATKRELTKEENLVVANIDGDIIRLRGKRSEYVGADIINWRLHCDATGTDKGDRSAFLQWSVMSGNGRFVEEIDRELRQLFFDRKTILDRKYSDPEDQDIVQADFDFESPQMRLRYPMYPDYEYSDRDRFSLEYLAGLPTGSSALFDDRRALTYNMTIPTMATTSAGAFSASWDRTTSASRSIQTDWSYSGGGGWGPFRARASASEQRKMQEEFQNVTSLSLSAKAAFKVAIVYPGWFRSMLFRLAKLKANIRDFADFFGPEGSLLYYPTHLILVRGFSVTFNNAQSWTFDYERKFNASAGGGFSAFGFRFGSKGSYGSHIKEHKVDKSNTNLTFSDGDGTLRFVGYTVRKNSLWSEASKAGGQRGGSPVTEPGENASALKTAT